jgi:hypothetical protein
MKLNTRFAIIIRVSGVQVPVGPEKSRFSKRKAGSFFPYTLRRVINIFF